MPKLLLTLAIRSNNDDTEFLDTGFRIFDRKSLNAADFSVRCGAFGLYAKDKFVVFETSRNQGTKGFVPWVCTQLLVKTQNTPGKPTWVTNPTLVQILSHNVS